MLLSKYKINGQTKLYSRIVQHDVAEAGIVYMQPCVPERHTIAA